MKTKDFEILDQNMLKKSTSGYLTLLTALTGSGKSYTVIQYIGQRILQQPLSHVFFITDFKKNLPINDFKEALRLILKKRNLSDRDFYSRVAIVRSLEDTVQAILTEQSLSRLNARFKVDIEFKNIIIQLRKKLKLYNSLEESNTRKEAYRSLKVAEFEFRKYLKKQLIETVGVKRLKEGEQQKHIRQYLKCEHNSNNQDFCDWLNEFYPTLDLESRSIYIMTTAKFIRSYTPFFQYSGESFLNSKFIKDALVVLDEFDGTKAQLLDKSVDDALKMKEDFLKLFKSIDDSLSKFRNDVPFALSKLCQDDEKVDKLVKEADELKKLFYVQLAYKSDLKTFEDNFILHLPYKRVASRGRSWWSKLDNAKRQVVITHGKRQAEQDLHFYRMLERVGSFIYRFASLVQKYAKMYAKDENNFRDELLPRMTVENAAYTIYSTLGFSEEQQQALVEVWSSWTRLKKYKKASLRPETYHQFQAEGLNFFVFADAERHSFETKISASSLRKTPENFLLAVLQKANILGLSATAEIPTVLNNYDLSYLKEQLGKKLISGYDLLTPETKASFDLSKQYEKSGVEIEVTQANILDPLDGGLAELIQRRLVDADLSIEGVDSELVKKIDQLIKEQTAGLKKYFYERYLKLFDSFVLFLISPKLTSFLGLQTPLPKTGVVEMDENFIVAIYEKLREALFVKDEKKPQLCVIGSGKKVAVQDQVIEALRLPSENDQRVYLLSSYQMLGVGQNLQHQIGDFEKGLIKSIYPNKRDKKDRRQDEVDLSGIYLGDITHTLPSVTNLNDLTSDLLLLIAKIEYLLDAGEINKSEVDRFLDGLSRNSRPDSKNSGESEDDTSNEKVRQFKDARSYVMSCTRMIVQAVGRMDRTHNKLAKIQIIVTEDTLMHFSTTGLNRKALSPEALAIEKFKQKNNLTDIVKSDDNYHSANTYQNLSYLSHIDFKKMALILQSDEVAARHFQEMRLFMLKNPTINNELLAKGQSDDARCLQYLPMRATQYSVHRKLYKEKDHNFETGIYQFQESKDKEMIVSSEKSGIQSMIKYQGKKESMESFFKHMGFPVKWIENDNIINPSQFLNGYLGILGEVAGKFILEDLWNIELKPIMNLRQNELFDFRTDSGVLIDFKNWRGQLDVDPLSMRKHVMKKLDQFTESERSSRVMIINVLQYDYRVKNQVSVTNNGRILEVSALIDNEGKLSLTEWDKKQIGDFFFE